MSEPTATEGIWQLVEHDDVATAFDARFHFRPDFYERTAAAIELPDRCLVVDLAPLFAQSATGFAAAQAAINAAALRAFVELAGEEEMVALDWNQCAFHYSPAAHDRAGLDWPVPVFPNGDYYIHATQDLRWGTFGHPWQESLSIWGDELIGSLGAELSTWLPRHPQTTG